MIFYSITRTYVNTLETVLFCLFLYFWPLTEKEVMNGQKNRLIGITIASIAFIIRPSSSILWFYFGLQQLFSIKQYKKRLSFIINTLIIGLSIIGLSIIIDRIFYGEWTITFMNFFKFNVLSGLSSFYGTHPFYWYFIVALPVISGLYIVPFVLEMYYKKNDHLLYVFFFFIFVLSFTKHKEFRFLFPLLPIISIFTGCYLARRYEKSKQNPKKLKIFKTIIGCIFIIHTIVALYLSLVHQRGPIDVVYYLQDKENIKDVWMLMPCHSTPLQSYIHRNDINIRYLDCSPPLDKTLIHLPTESDIFYDNPLKWIKDNLSSEKKPSLIIMYDDVVLKDNDVLNYIESFGYRLCKKFFNSHISDGKKSKYIEVYCL